MTRKLEDARYERKVGSYNQEFLRSLIQISAIPIPVAYIDTGSDLVDAMLETFQWAQQWAMSVYTYNPVNELKSTPGFIHLPELDSFRPLLSAIGQRTSRDGKILRNRGNQADAASAGNNEAVDNRYAVSAESIYSSLLASYDLSDYMDTNCYTGQLIDETNMINNERYFASVELERDTTPIRLIRAILNYVKIFQKRPIENSKVWFSTSEAYRKVNPEDTSKFKAFRRKSLLILEGLRFSELNSPEIITALRYASEILKYGDGYILLMGSGNILPEELKSVIPIFHYNTPTEAEREYILERTYRDAGKEGSLENANALVRASNGLSRVELRRGAREAIVVEKRITSEFISRLRKERLSTGYGLQWHEPNADFSFQALGGFAGLKNFVDTVWKNNTTEHKPKSLLALGVPGVGKAQPLDAKVLTDSGFVKMGDICVGDRLPSPKGGFVTVTGIFPQGVKPIYRVKTSYCCSTECTADHLWLTTTRLDRQLNKEGEVKTLQSLRDALATGDKYDHALPTHEPVEFGPESKLPLNPYYLGVLLANSVSNTLSVVFGAERTDVRAKFSAYIRNAGDASQTFIRRDSTSQVNIRESEQGGLCQTRQALTALNLINSKGAKLHIPDIYLKASALSRLLLLQGFVDSNATPYNHTLLRCSIANSQLAEDLAFLVRSLGGCAISLPASKTRDRTDKKSNPHRLYIRFINGVCPFTSAYLRYQIKETCWSSLHTIESIMYVGDAECQCISVSSEDGLYFTDDFIVTHNTMFCKALGNELGLDTVIFNIDGVLNSLVGSSEDRLRSTLKLIDDTGQCVVVLDEFEKLLGSMGGTERDGGVSSRVLSILLKWLQDKDDSSIVVATCNNAEALPIELLRAQRFDSRWFLDLPPVEIRYDIVKYYSDKYGIKSMNTGPYSVIVEDVLRGWSGAEIELAVKYAAMQGGDLGTGLKYVIPIIKSSESSIQRLRNSVENAYLCGYTGEVYNASKLLDTF